MCPRPSLVPRCTPLVTAWLLAACAREQARPADTAVAAIPAARACLARDTVLEYDNQRGGDEGDDPSGERIILRRAGGRWSGIARSFYTPDDSVIDSLTIDPATGAIRFILWPRSRGPVDFRGTIDCDSIPGARKSMRYQEPAIEDVYRKVAPLANPSTGSITLDPGRGVDTTAPDRGPRVDGTSFRHEP
jgi:hypothetical protein